MAKQQKILAIDPGIRHMGVAYLEGEKIVYHGVRMIPKKESLQDTLREERKMILRLIKDLKPKIVAVEKSFFANNPNPTLLNVFMDEIRAIGRRKDLIVIGYAPSTVKKFICGNGMASKKEVAKVIVSQYPELRAYIKQNRVWKEKYHQNMFDAVAVGVMALRRKA